MIKFLARTDRVFYSLNLKNWTFWTEKTMEDQSCIPDPPKASPSVFSLLEGLHDPTSHIQAFAEGDRDWTPWCLHMWTQDPKAGGVVPVCPYKVCP